VHGPNTAAALLAWSLLALVTGLAWGWLGELFEHLALEGITMGGIVRQRQPSLLLLEPPLAAGRWRLCCWEKRLKRGFLPSGTTVARW